MILSARESFTVFPKVSTRKIEFLAKEKMEKELQEKRDKENQEQRRLEEQSIFDSLRTVANESAQRLQTAVSSLIHTARGSSSSSFQQGVGAGVGGWPVIWELCLGVFWRVGKG